MQPDHRLRRCLRIAPYVLIAHDFVLLRAGLSAICVVATEAANRRRVSQINFPPSPTPRIQAEEARARVGCTAISAIEPRRLRRSRSRDPRRRLRRHARRLLLLLCGARFAPAACAGRPSSAARMDSSRNEMSFRPRSTESSSGVMPNVVPAQVGAAAQSVARRADVPAIDRVEQSLVRLHIQGRARRRRSAARSRLHRAAPAEGRPCRRYPVACPASPSGSTSAP